MPPPMRLKGKLTKPKNIKATIARLFTYLKPYRARLVLVGICILFSALVTAAAALFMQLLIDGFIIPVVKGDAPVMPLAAMLALAGSIFGIGIFSGYLYNRLMITIAHGVLRQIRDEMFAHMQTLPIR